MASMSAVLPSASRASSGQSAHDTKTPTTCGSPSAARCSAVWPAALIEVTEAPEARAASTSAASLASTALNRRATASSTSGALPANSVPSTPPSTPPTVASSTASAAAPETTSLEADALASASTAGNSGGEGSTPATATGHRGRHLVGRGAEKLLHEEDDDIIGLLAQSCLENRLEDLAHARRLNELDQRSLAASDVIAALPSSEGLRLALEAFEGSGVVGVAAVEVVKKVRTERARPFAAHRLEHPIQHLTEHRLDSTMEYSTSLEENRTTQGNKGMHERHALHYLVKKTTDNGELPSQRTPLDASTVSR
eukprot:scaffold219897_cov27-Tisochrysis_lutea.AAC.1